MKILYWDTENTPIICAAWGLWDQNIGHDAIIEDWVFICACWLWEGSNKVESVAWEKIKDKKKSPILGHSDEKIVRKLHAVLSEADVLIAQNGDEFDLKKFNTRALFYGLPPIPPKQSVDTLKVAKRVFRFTSNKLDFMGKYLGVGGKIETKMTLWMDVMSGSQKALNYMVKYCGNDVIKLRKIYKKLLPYITNHPNQNIYRAITDKLKCTNCKDGNLKKNGFKYTRTGKKQQYQCTCCGAWSTDKKTLATAKVR